MQEYSTKGNSIIKKILSHLIFPFPQPSTLHSSSLQQSRAEKGANKHNSTANKRRLAHITHKQGASSRARSRSSSTGSAARSSVGSNSSHAAGTGRSSSSRLAAGILATSTSETGALAGAVLHVVGGSVGESGQVVAVEVLDVPGVAVGRAWAGGAVGLVAAVTGGSGVLAELLHQGLEVLVLGVGVAADAAEAVLRFFLRVLVDKAAGVDGGHVGVVEGLDGAKGAGVLVAAVFGKAERG
jgi:hypothetical protein